jgi:hypothetical protein
MFQTYAYQILQDKAANNVYYEATHRDKQIQFIKTEEMLWEMYYQGIHIADIIPGEVVTYGYIDNIILNTAFDILRHTMVNIIVSDEAYQLVNSIEVLS